MAKPIPEGYHSVTPYLVVDDANAAIEFYKRAFGATEKFRMPMGDRIGHAEIQIGDSIVMLADEFPDMGHLGPKSRGGTTSSLMVYVDDVDTAFKQGDRRRRRRSSGRSRTSSGATGWARCSDPFGHQWSLATHVEEVSPEEMQQRMEQLSAQQKQAEPA